MFGMQKLKKIAKYSAVSAAVVLGIGLILLLVARIYIHPENYRKDIISFAKQKFGLEMEFGRIELTFLRPGLTVGNVLIKGHKHRFGAERVNAYLSISSLVTGKIRVKKIEVLSPHAVATFLPGKKWNFESLLEKMSEKKQPVELPDRITVKNGRLEIVDESDGGEPVRFELSNINAAFSKAVLLRPMKMALSAKIEDSMSPGEISAKMESWSNSPDWNWGDKLMEGKLTVKSVNARMFGPYLSDYVPERYIGKLYTGELGFSGRLNQRTKFKGELSGGPISTPLAAGPTRRFVFSGSHSKGRVEMDNIEIQLPEAAIKGKMTLDDYSGKAPTLAFKVDASMIKIGDLKEFVPYQFREHPMVNFIESFAGKGSVGLSGLSFNGPVSAFENLKDPQNFRLLSGKIIVKDFNLKLDNMLRPLEDISGQMTLAGDELAFSEVRAVYGGSTVKNMAGKITDIHGAPKVSVKAEADLSVKEFRDDLAERIASPRLAELIKPIKNMTGRVQAVLVGEADLQKPEITSLSGDFVFRSVGFYHDLYKANVEHLNGTIVATKDDIRIDGVTCRIEKGLFKADGSITGYSTPNYYMDVKLETSGELTRLANTRFFNLAIFKNIVGPAATSLKMSGTLDDLNFVQTANLTDAEIHYKDLLEKGRGTELTEIFSGRVYEKNKLHINSGRVNLGKSTVEISGDVLEVPEIKGYDVVVNLEKLSLGELEGYVKMLGHKDVSGTVSGTGRFSQGMGADVSSVAVKGKIANLNLEWLKNLDKVWPIAGALQLEGAAQGAFDLSWSRGGLKMNGRISGKNVGFTTVLAKPLRGFYGDLILKGNTIRLKNLGGKIGASFGQVGGTIVIQKEPSFDLNVDARKLNLDDLVQVGGNSAPAEPRPEQTSEGTKTRSRYNINIKSKSGKIGSLSYAELASSLAYYHDRLKFNDFVFNSNGGKCRASAEIDFRGDLPMFKTKMNVRDVELADLFAEIWPNMDKVTGKMDAEGAFSGKGLAWGDARKNLDGTMHFKVVDGQLAQFSGISSVFSVLNVVPMFQTRTGRQEGKGLPFEFVSGDMAIKNGVGRTTNMVLEGNVVRMSGAGDFDFSKGEVSILLGVKPFTSLDKLLSSVPIAGKLLTGDEKSLIVYYYEVKGDMGNPVATAVPSETIGRTLIGFVRRLLEPAAKALSSTPQKDGGVKGSSGAKAGQ